VLQTGMGKRQQSFMWIITTAGSSIEGPCYQLRDYCIKVLARKVVDESIFAIIYTIDAEDMPRALTDERVWMKANPEWGNAVDPDTVRNLALEAQHNPSKQAAFLTRHLNVWVGAAAPYFDNQAWADCADAPPQSAFEGEPVWIGVDLATKSDIASRADVYVRQQEDGPHYYLYTHHYLNEEATKEGKNAATYAAFAKQHHLIVTPGNVTDFGAIKADIDDAAQHFRVEAFCFDPWQAQHMAQEFQANGMVTVEVKPNVANFSHVMKELLALSKTRHLHHDGNGVMAWMVGNVEAVEDRNANVFPRKAGDQKHKKIDGVVATLNALNRAMSGDSGGLIYIDTL
jgi:phage terminase large subunit-like protein